MTFSSIHKPSYKLAIAAAVHSTLLAGAAQAHVTYQDFGSFSGLASSSVTVSNAVATGNYGWADAADADWGDSHKAKWFSFTLQNAATVTLSVAAKADATTTSIDGFTPAFSLYLGLAPTTVDPDNPLVVYKSYDTSTSTQAYRATLPFATEGAWNALSNFQIGNDYGDIGTLSYVGHAANDAAASFISQSFTLAAGSYSFLVGGADYAAQAPGNPLLTAKYGLSATLDVSAVPEPETYTLMLVGLGLVAAVARKSNARHARHTRRA